MEDFFIFEFIIYQARSQGRESEEVRPGGRAKRSDNPKFLRIFSDEKYKIGEDRRGNCLVCLMLATGLSMS